MSIRVKRVYDKPAPADGRRVLVDRIWPRGLKKTEARVGEWLKDLAPSTGLRKWFGHDPVRWKEFKKQYAAELDDQRERIKELAQEARKHTVTLLFAAKDTEHNNAVALKEHLQQLTSRPMPELPDVETFKRYLDATSLHQRIADVDVRSADLLKGISERELARRLKGRRFECSCRHGKHLFVRTDGHIWLRLHFGMTGSLRYFKGEEKAPPHTRVLFVFAKDYRLAFDDQRKFGEVGLVNELAEFMKKRALGPDALDVDLPEFKKVFAKHRGAVKAILMNQRLIAGIGNIYADEILFRARIHPATQVTRLGDKALAKLFRAMRYVLEKAIKARADVDQIPKSWLLPHRHKGGKCPRCGRKLRSSKIGGRTAWFCPHCQRRGL